MNRLIPASNEPDEDRRMGSITRVAMVVGLMLLAVTLFDAEVWAAPRALFDVDFVAGIAPFDARFTYVGDPSQVDVYLWEFGDGATSAEQNPTHTYDGTVSRPVARLTVTQGVESDSNQLDMRVYPPGFVPAGTIYYIDATLGDDGHSGLTPLEAKRDLNAMSRPEAGDTILFKRGEVWEDPDSGAALYIRESGIPGYPITYGAYGDPTDPKPRIRRQAIVPGWTDPANWTNLDFAEANWLDWSTRSASVAYSPLNSRCLLPANYLSQDGTRVRIAVGGSALGDVEIASAYFGEKASSGDPYDIEPGTITRITFGGTDSTIISGGATEVSDWIDYAFDHTKDYIISLGINGPTEGVYASGSYFETSYYAFGVAADAGNPDASSGYLRLNGFWDFAGFGIDNSGVLNSNIWYIETLAQDPERVFLSGQEAGVVETRGRLNSQYSWMYDYVQGRLYIFSQDNPATAFSSMEVAGIYGTPLSVDRKDYLIFTDLDLQGGRGGATVDTYGCNNIIIENCDIGKDSGNHGVAASSSGSGRYTRNGIVRNNNIDADNHVVNYWHAQTTNDGIWFLNGVKNWTAHDNTIKGWAHTGIMFGNLDSVFETTDNDIYNNYITCPDIEYGRGFGTLGEAEVFYNNKFHHNVIKDTTINNQIQSTGFEFYNNIIDGVSNPIGRTDAERGIVIYRPDYQTHGADTTGLHIYNNVFANVDAAAIAFSSNNVNGDYYDNILANNIFYNTARDAIHNDLQLVIEDMPTQMYDNVYENNVFYKPTGENLIYYGNDPANNYVKTLAEFNAMDGTHGDVIRNNIADDPLFLNPNDPLGPDGIIFTADDGFRLRWNSPAIDAGVDVGLPYQGAAPDIGAYEYTPPSPVGNQLRIVKVPTREPHLIWMLVSDAASYDVMRCEPLGGVPCTPMTIANTMADNYTDTTVSSIDYAWYRVASRGP